MCHQKSIPTYGNSSQGFLDIKYSEVVYLFTPSGDTLEHVDCLQPHRLAHLQSSVGNQTPDLSVLQLSQLSSQHIVSCLALISTSQIFIYEESQKVIVVQAKEELLPL